ncbi:hypothetical protein [Nonomuraea sp. NPDC050643]|uniref:hypothetical protein n=1 Tax=Nonomuraea sp. NPDC050643 TaxID=3155660 RepID=UPI0033C4FAEF
MTTTGKGRALIAGLALGSLLPSGCGGGERAPRAGAAAGALPDLVDMGPEAASTLAQAGVLRCSATSSAGSKREA